MTPRRRRVAVLLGGLCLTLLLVVLFRSAPRHPVAWIRVVDSAGVPVAGAVVQPDGLRAKQGNYSGAHYGWTGERGGVASSPVTTDSDGLARVPYPKYIFERIETGEISFSVQHPDFVPDRPFRTVTSTPPAGAPWRVWADYLWGRILRKQLVVKPVPVVLQRGAVLELTVAPDSAGPKNTPLYAQSSAGWSHISNFWARPEPGTLITRRFPVGEGAVRAVRFDANGAPWFSEVVVVDALADTTNRVAVNLKPGVTLHGELDHAIPRPVLNGRVVLHVSPPIHYGEGTPPQWHAWTPVQADGSFRVDSLPAGELEVVALCDGYVSTNGPGRFGGRYPQKHVLDASELDIVIGMEPTARLEVEVLDDQGKPLRNARVVTWPNVHYDQWGSTILAGDCYNTRDWFLPTPTARPELVGRSVHDFEGTTDESGLAVLPNLPVEADVFSVEHPEFVLPAVATSGSARRREARITLTPGGTNHAMVRLERRDRSPIAHY